MKANSKTYKFLIWFYYNEKFLSPAVCLGILAGILSLILNQVLIYLIAGSLIVIIGIISSFIKLK